MILNNTKNRVVGVVKDPDIKSEYTGKTTSTATVRVDNQTKEISVDVNTYGLLGLTADKAFPGNKGQATYDLAQQLRKDIQDEVSRSQIQEKYLKHLIDDAYDQAIENDSICQIAIQEETQRAINVEETLKQQLDDVYKQTTEKFLDVDSNIVSIKKSAEKTKNELSSSLRQLEDDLFDEFVEFSDKVYHELDKVEKTHKEFEIYSEENYATKEELIKLNKKIKDDIQPSLDIITDDIKNVKSTYATKVYLHEEIHNALTLSKQLVDSVDLITNTVVINGIVSKPVDGVLYMLRDASSTTEDIYKEYTTIDNVLTLIGDTSINLDGYATENYVDKQIDAIPEVDLTPYAKKTDIPDVSSFIAEIPAEYITEDELQGKGYYTLEKINELLKSIEFIDGGTSASV